MGFDPLALAAAMEYARLENERKYGRAPRARKRRKSNKTGWALLFWFLGFGFVIAGI